MNPNCGIESVLTKFNRRWLMSSVRTYQEYTEHPDHQPEESICSTLSSASYSRKRKSLFYRQSKETPKSCYIPIRTDTKTYVEKTTKTNSKKQNNDLYSGRNLVLEVSRPIYNSQKKKSTETNR